MYKVKMIIGGEMRDNRFKKQIENGEKPIGIFAGMCSPFAVECVGYAGFDSVAYSIETSLMID